MGLCRPIVAIVTLGLAIGPTSAAELRVMASNGFAAAFRQIAPEFERATSHQVFAIYGPSSGRSTDALASRLGRDEDADVIIMARPALDELVSGGKVDGASRVDLARSGTGVFVRSGAPHPDVSTVGGLKQALLDARVIAVSDGLSGAYVMGPLLDRLGIAASVRAKVKRIEGPSAALAVARGEADLGFQATSEILATPNVDYLGPLPREVQDTTVLAVALCKGAKGSPAAQDLIDFLRSPPAGPVIMKTGLEPILDRSEGLASR